MPIRKVQFCQRKVALVPRMRMTVTSATMKSEAPRIQLVLVSNEDPQLINWLLVLRLPNATRAGPRAKTAKNFAK